MTPEKLKIWKVYESDHKKVGKLFRHDQTQPMVFRCLITEPKIQKILDEKLDKAIAKNEEAKKRGHIMPALQGGDLAISALKEIKSILQERTE